MDELISSLKVHEQELMDKIQLLKGKVIALIAFQKTNTRHQPKSLNSIVAFDSDIVMMSFVKKVKKKYQF